MGKILNTNNPGKLNSLEIRNKMNKANIILEEDEIKILVNGREKYNLGDISGGKQDTLVSGTNIKTINGNSIIGGGNMVIDIPDELNGTNYLMVYGTGTPTENAAELQAAYNEAKTMSTSNNNRITVVVAPGEYNFGEFVAFNVNTSGIDIKSLTGKKDVLINIIDVSSDYVYVSGINCGTGKFYVSSELPNIIIENCEGGNYSFCGEGGNVASGTFNYCTGGDYSFGGAGGNASGSFNNCIGGNYSFGGSGGSITGKLINCKLTSGTFVTPTGAGKIYNSIDGNGNLINSTIPSTVFLTSAGTLPTASAGIINAKYGYINTTSSPLAVTISGGGFINGSSNPAGYSIPAYTGVVFITDGSKWWTL